MLRWIARPANHTDGLSHKVLVLTPITGNNLSSTVEHFAVVRIAFIVMIGCVEDLHLWLTTCRSLRAELLHGISCVTLPDLMADVRCIMVAVECNVEESNAA